MKKINIEKILTERMMSESVLKNNYESFIIIENSTKNKYIKNICREGKDRIRPLLNPTDIKYIEDKY
mgnify:CR=1 FL=1